MKPINSKLQTKIKQLRKKGLTHRQIALQLSLSLGTVFNYSKGINLTFKQKELLNKRNYLKCFGKLSPSEKFIASQKGGKNSHIHVPPKYTKDNIILLFRSFYEKHKRIPTKREFVGIYRSVLNLFGTWNKAIIEAGFSPNPVLFAKKYYANDGHKCDSLSEKIIDDWLSARNISHFRNAHYPNHKKYTADFKVKDYFIEFFCLHHELKSYDDYMQKKLKLINNNHLKLISIFPKDLFPISQLDSILGKFSNKYLNN